jgi:hypothetical protein
VLAAHLTWSEIGTGDPPAVAILAVAVAGAVGALFVQKYVIVVGTALIGAWTVVVWAANQFPARGVARGSSETEVWILYPTSGPAYRWIPLAWIALALVGTIVQLSTLGRKRRSR